MEWIKVEGRGEGVGRCFVMIYGIIMATGGFINGIVHSNQCWSKVKLRPLIWEVRNFMLDDFSNFDFEPA